MDTAKSSACGRIVARTYRELIARGYGDQDAFRSAVSVYRIRHPEAGSDAPFVVAGWICEESEQ